MMDYDDVWFRSQVTKLSRDLADLKATVDFQKRVLEMQSSHIAELRQANKVGKEAPRVVVFDETDEINRLKKENDNLRATLRGIIKVDAHPITLRDGVVHLKPGPYAVLARLALGEDFE